MDAKSLKRKMTMALKEMMTAARKYIEAENELDRIIREENVKNEAIADAAVREALGIDKE